RTLGHRHHPMVVTSAADTTLVGVDEVDLEVGGDSPGPDPEGAGRGAVDPEVVDPSGVAKSEPGSDRLGLLRTSTPGTGVEPRLRHLVVRGVRLHRRRQ